MNTDKKYCSLPKRNLPVISEVDIIVAGATLGGISAALQGAKSGAKVFVIGYMPYLGEDLCGTYKYLYEEQEINHPLLKALFSDDENRTPFKVKKVLENALLENDIEFIYSSYVTQVLQDAQKEPVGVIITNRSGQQVIQGKVIIDATTQGSVAKIAGVEFQQDKIDHQQFQFITVGNTEYREEQRLLPISPKRDQHEFPVNEYTFEVSPDDWSYSSICKIEQDIRGYVWDPDQVDTADTLFYIPPFKIKGQMSYTHDSFYSEHMESKVFCPEGIKRLFVLSSCADVTRKVAPDLLKPANIIPIGEKIGRKATEIAKSIPELPEFSIEANPDTGNAIGTVQMEAPLVRPSVQKYMWIDRTPVPILNSYDVVVVGGGTVGANAGISAARHGAKTLVIEYLHGLGGTQTMGKIGVYWDGFREGFTRVIDKGVSEMAPSDHFRQKTKPGHSNVDWKTEWYRRQVRKAGGDIWFGVLGSGALTDHGDVKGVLVSTPQGSGVVLADVVIDSTGSGDIAIAANAEYEYTDEKLFAVQGAGLPPVNLGDHYNNTDWTFIDDTDVVDVTRLYVSGKAK